jgi:hypothetical protein
MRPFLIFGAIFYFGVIARIFVMVVVPAMSVVHKYMHQWAI